jgi:putative tricarboxylic transport membrane protein
MRKRINEWGLFAAAALLPAAPLHAQPWTPAKPVEIVIGTSASGAQDRTGRTIQKLLQEKKWLPAPITVLNKPGGAGAVGLAYLNQHAGDAHYLMVNSITLLTNHITGKSSLNYTDFTPLAITGVEYVGFTVRAESPLKSGRDVVERLRKDPAGLAVAIGTGLGNASHLSFVLAMKAAGVDIRKLKTIAFSSAGESMTALLGGHIDAVVGATSNAIQHVRAGKVRMLAVSAPQRLAGELASVPTWREQGVDAAFDLWRGLAGPRGLTRAQVQYWDDVLGRMAQSPEWKKELAALDMEDVYKNSADTARHWKAEYDEVKAVLAELGLAR